MDGKKSLRVVLLANYGSSYEVLLKILERGIRPQAVFFAPEKVQRLGWKRRIENLFSYGSFKEPKFLLSRYSIPYYFVPDHNSVATEEMLRRYEPDLLLLYGTRIIKPNILGVPKIGTLNAHSSLLPKYRGSKSEFWILHNGDLEYAGVTIHWVTPGLDEGDIFLQRPLEVEPNETPRSLREKSRPLAGQLYAEAIALLEKGTSVRIPQDESKASKFKKPTAVDIEAFEKKARTYPEGRIKKAIAWLLNSGIQNAPGSTDTRGIDISGSFNAWFNPNARTHTYAYTEISGYALTSLTHLHDELKDTEFLRRAERAADWLLSIQTKEGAFPTAFYKVHDAPQKPNEYHTFDVGMVLNGLVNLYRATKNKKYLDAGKRAGDWLVSQVRSTGSLPATLGDEGGVKDHPGTWSTQSGPYHTKNVIGLLNLYDLTKEEVYKKAAVSLSEYALTRQTPEGQFLTYGELWGTNLHPHLYTAEGLYVAGEYLQEARYTDASRRATNWALDNMKDGIVPRHKQNESLNYNERADILAQAYRMGRLISPEHPGLTELLHKITEYQSLGDDPRQYGGFLFGKSSTGDSLPHVNAWVTMFMLQALMLAPGGRKFKLFYLV